MSWNGMGFIDDGEVSIDLPGELSHESMEQAQAASHAVQDIVKSGAMGDPSAKYTISMAGHANVNHEPQAGYANDYLNVVITQAGEV